MLLGARKDRDVVAANSVDFLMYSGWAMMAYFWAQMAAESYARLQSGEGVETDDFYRTKIQTAEFYFDRLLPRSKAHATAITTPVRSTMQTPIERFVER
ncbi:MAG: acyl-CoA dehydrogenase C-terminal domain-containing protein [Polyangiales bacterium]